MLGVMSWKTPARCRRYRGVRKGWGIPRVVFQSGQLADSV